MAVISTLIFIVLISLYFGLIRLFDHKNKELLHFIVLYVFAFSFILCLDYIFIKGTNGLPANGSLLIGFLIYIFRTIGMESITDINNFWFLFFYRTSIAVLFYFSPTFLASYLLYPFKTLKRNKVLIWLLSGYTLMVIGVSVLLFILVAFSNM